MSGLKTRGPTIISHGIYAEHDQACAVRWRHKEKAVYQINEGVFHPSWIAQAHGWRLVHADTWLKRAVCRMVFGR